MHALCTRSKKTTASLLPYPIITKENPSVIIQFGLPAYCVQVYFIKRRSFGRTKTSPLLPSIRTNLLCFRIMGGRTLRPRDVEDPKRGSKGKGKPASVKIESKASRKKIEPLYENEPNIDPWLENGDWSRLFSEQMLAAVRAAKSREEWEIKITICVGQMALQVRHVPGHRVPEVLSFFQPITSGVVHAAGERPFFEKKLKELQSELSVGFETVSRMFLSTQVGKEYVETFWKAK